MKEEVVNVMNGFNMSKVDKWIFNMHPTFIDKYTTETSIYGNTHSQ